MKVRKKPLVINAWKLDSQAQMVDKPNWVIHAINEDRICFIASPAASPYSDYWVIETLTGTTVAYDGDYVMRGAVGEFYPCRKDVFEKTYDILEEQEGDK